MTRPIGAPVGHRIGCLLTRDVTAWSHAFTGEAARYLVVVDRGRVVGATRAARRAGVELGVAAERAGALLPSEARVVPRDVERERAAWEALCARVNEATPRLESPWPGLLFLEPLEEADALRLARNLRLSGAEAPDRRSAVLAAHRAPSRQALCITPSDRQAFLGRCSVALLRHLGIGRATIERLRLFGYATIGSMRHLTRRHLTAQLGEEGEEIHALLHSRGEERVARYQPPASVVATYDVEEHLEDTGQVRQMLKETLARAVAALEGRRVQRLTLTLGMRSGAELRAVRVLREARGEEEVLRRSLERLLEERARSDAFTSAGGVPALRTLTVKLGSLRERAARQASLFDERPGVARAVRAVHRRYPGAVLRCVLNEDAVFPEDRCELVPVESEGTTMR